MIFDQEMRRKIEEEGFSKILSKNVSVKYNIDVTNLN